MRLHRARVCEGSIVENGDVMRSCSEEFDHFSLSDVIEQALAVQCRRGASGLRRALVRLLELRRLEA